MKKGKVVLVGTGFVGMSMAYTMLNRGGVNELILIDIDKDKTKGEEMDLNHGMPFAPMKMVIKAGDYPDCSDAEVVVITAGVAQKPGETRLELAETNANIMRGITKNIMASGFDGVDYGNGSQTADLTIPTSGPNCYNDGFTLYCVE